LAAGRKDVRFLGYVVGERKRALLQQADVYAAPSHMESYGLAIVEALASGCPVVATNGTPWEELDSYRAGRWVAPDRTAFRDAIRAVVGRGRATFERGARALATEHSWERRAREMVAAYEDLLEKARQSGGR
jgi:glycosyltransferase involved in cell wall biosynthesis